MLDNYAGPKVRVLKWVKDEARAADGDKRLKDTRTSLTAEELQKAIKISKEVNGFTREQRTDIQTLLKANTSERAPADSE